MTVVRVPENSDTVVDGEAAPIANDNGVPRRKAPRLRSSASGELSLAGSLGWRQPNAPAALAAALGEIAADLWLAGLATLTDTPIVATLGVSDVALSSCQVANDQAEGLGS